MRGRLVSTACLVLACGVAMAGGPIATSMPRGEEYAPIDKSSFRSTTEFQATDQTALTARYTSGRAFGARDNRGWSVRMDQEAPEQETQTATDRRANDGAGRGMDAAWVPDELVAPGSGSMGYRIPVQEGVDMVLGAEYQNRPNAYHGAAVSAGFLVRF